MGTRKTIIICTALILAIIVSFLIMKITSNKKADEADYQTELRLKEISTTLDLQPQLDIEGRLSEVDDLNTLLEPTNSTAYILKRWEAVHQVDPNYPYPETEIEREDWMGINQFLRGENGAKTEMVLDENGHIDDEVYEYIISGVRTSHPVIEEAEEKIE